VRARRPFSVALALALAAAPEAAAETAEDEQEPDPRAGSGAETSVHAKDLGLHSPRGRRIYREEESFLEVLDSHRRIFIIEAAAGAGPEGNLGLVLGWMPKQIKGIEFFGGAGIDLGPAVYVSGAVRFLFNIRGVRPYLGAGYFYKDAYRIETYAHNAFLELGHSWKLGPTNHLSVGLGVARILHTGVKAASPLRTPDVDPASLDEQIRAVPRYLPMASARFSRAF
jgi:hypothetical protein